MKRKNFEKQPSPCGCLNLRRASLAITKRYDQMLAPSGLTISQYSLLRHIKILGPVSMSDLAFEMRLDRTTLVRNLKPLENEFLVINVSPKGTRNRLLQLTEEGIVRYKIADLLWEEAQNFIEQQLGKDNLQHLTALLSMVERLEP